MADLFGTMSSFLKKIKQKTGLGTVPSETESPAEASSSSPGQPLPDESRLRSLGETEFRSFIAAQPERAVTRLLQSVADQELQLRIIQAVSDEATLKRIGRSELDKKLKRAAEKKLRETGSEAAKLKLQKLIQLGDTLQAFFQKPDWQGAPELLALVSDPEALRELADAGLDRSSPPFSRFTSLRERLRRELDEYERTCAELEGICEKLAPSRPVSKAELAKLAERWKDLEAKYSFPDDHPLIRKYEQALEARQTRRAPAPRPAPDRQQDERKEQEKEAARRQKQEQEKKNEQKRLGRAAALESIVGTLQELSQALGSHKTATRLRELQAELATLRRWKKEYPEKLEEAETQLKAFLLKNTEALSEAKWDTWARTDRASRIQAELEKLIGELEAEQDAAVAMGRAVGLAERLYEYAKEMREMGSLERSKDHKIWEQFKALSDRGWALCDRMRLLVLEQLKATLSEHAAKPIDVALPALSNPRATLEFKPEAYGDAVAARVDELRSLWRDIGGKSSEGNREAEAVMKRLFELYFKQRNLHLGQLKRQETQAIQRKREILNELKIACEGKSTLISRLRVAKGFEDKWRKAPLPDVVATEFQTEFETYQAQLDAQLTREIEAHCAQVEALQARAEPVLESLRSKSAGNIPHTLKSVSGMENELQAMEKHLAQFKGLRAPQPAEERFQELRGRIRAVFEESRKLANEEIAARAGERDQALAEAQALALSTDWEKSRTRFEELRALWKKVGALGQKEDAAFDLFFENAWQFYLARSESQARELSAEQKAQALKARKELLCALEALARFKDSKPAPEPLPLPFSDEERAKAAGKVLEFGMKYKQVFSLDPSQAVLKETKKIMAQWSKLGAPDDEALPEFWKYYLKRVQQLL